MTKVVTFALVVLFLVVARETRAQVENDFQAELQQHAATWTGEQSRMYVHSRILKMTKDAAEADGVLLSDTSLYLDGVLLGDAAISIDGVLLGDAALGEIQDIYCGSSLLPQTFCLGWSACLVGYESDLASSTNSALQMLSSCEAMPSSGFISCAGDILADHSAAILAVQQRRFECHANVLADWLPR